MRILLTRRGCHHCNQSIKVINKINLKLNLNNKIRIIDCGSWEKFGLRDIPLMKTFEKMGLNEGYPFCYIDAIIIEPAPTSEQFKILLESFLKDELN